MVKTVTSSRKTSRQTLSDTHRGRLTAQCYSWVWSEASGTTMAKPPELHHIQTGLPGPVFRSPSYYVSHLGFPWDSDSPIAPFTIPQHLLIVLPKWRSSLFFTVGGGEDRKKRKQEGRQTLNMHPSSRFRSRTLMEAKVSLLGGKIDQRKTNQLYGIRNLEDYE